MFIRQNHHSYCMPIFDYYGDPDSTAYFNLTNWELNGFKQWLHELNMLNAQIDNEKDKADIKTYSIIRFFQSISKHFSLFYYEYLLRLL